MLLVEKRSNFIIEIFSKTMLFREEEKKSPVRPKQNVIESLLKAILSANCHSTIPKNTRVLLDQEIH